MKAKKILAFALSVMAAGAVAIGVSGYKGMTAYAADTQTAVEQQTIEGELTVGEQTNGSMTLKWSRIDAAKGYTVSLSDSSGNVIVKQSLGVKELSVKFDGLDGNVTYLARLEVLTSDDELITVKETEVYQPLAQPAFSLSAATDRVTVSWKKVYGADEYAIFSYDPGTKKYFQVASASGSSVAYSLGNLDPGTDFYYTVAAVDNSGDAPVYSDYYDKQQEIVTKLVTPNVTGVSNNVNIVTVNWKETPGVDGYQLWTLNKDTGKYDKIANISKTKTKFSSDYGVVMNEKSVYKFRSYKKVNGVWRFSPFTAEFSITPKFVTPEITSLTNDVNKLTVKWEKTGAVDGYQVWIYDKSTKKYIKVKNIAASKKSAKFSKYVSYGVKNKVKIRAYKKINGKNHYSPWSAVHSITPKINKVEVKSIKNDVNKITLKWKSAGSVGGYYIYLYNTGTKKYVKVKTAGKDKTSVTFSKKVLLNKNNKVKIRAFKTIDGKKRYGAYSKVQTVKPTLKKPTITALTVNEANKITLKWKDMGSVGGYQVFMYNTSAKKYKKLANVKTGVTTYTNSSDIPYNTTVKLKVRSYKKIGGKYYYSKFSKVGSVKTLKAKYTIVIDPGHLKGGNYTGDDYDNVIGSYSEAKMSLTLGKYLRDYLIDYGFAVKMTRETDQDYNLALEDRGLMAKGADFLLSLHSNAGGSSAQAVYAYCCIDGSVNYLGLMLSEAVANTMGVPDGGVINLVGDDGRDYYCVLRNAKKVGVSSIMVEHSYHTNDYSRNWLLNSSNLKKLAKAEADVLAEYFGLK